MTKKLTITYGDTTLYDGEPGKVSWTETAAGVVEVKAEPARASFLQQLAQNKPQRPQLADDAEQNG